MARPGDGGSEPPSLPQEPIHRLTTPLARFLHVEAASGGVLLAAAAIAVIAANGPWNEAYLAFWKTPLGFELGDVRVSHSLQHWINDGLMTVFFFVIGLEVKREIVLGELREVRAAALPLAGAVGGMVAPAAVFLAFQAGGPGADGWGIPMATDIAFVVGCMAVLGRRVPHGLRVLILSLAIADDIGAILVVAIGYTETILLMPLAVGGAGIAIVGLLQRLGVRSIGIYVGMGVLAWIGFHESGVHATINGVILGLMTPAHAYLENTVVGRAVDRASDTLGGGDWEELENRVERIGQLRTAAREALSPLEYLEAKLHPWVGFVIMPVFALANAGVRLEVGALGDPVGVAVAAGLVLGKPLGIVAMCYLAVRLGWARLPARVDWWAVAGIGFLAGIGFTMALFIASLALAGPVLDAAKVGILGGSIVAAVCGVAILVWKLPASPTDAP